MRVVSQVAVAVVTAVAGVAGAPARARTAATNGPQGAQQRAMSEATTKAATPGPERARLAKLVGEGNLAVRMWVALGAAPPEVAGLSSRSTVLGGRDLSGRATGTMMREPFEGMGWTGYDDVTKRYEGAWVDDMGPAVMSTRGRWNAGGNVFTAAAEEPDATTGKMTTMRMVTRFVCADKRVSGFLTPGPEGAEFKTVEVTSTRR
jgi:Protein of unknown function (DUF1579)